MVKPDLVQLLGSQPDFLQQPTLVEELLAKRGHAVLFLPKFHAELNPVERIWATAKRYTRDHCTFKLKHLRRILPTALSIALPELQSYFDHCAAWLTAYGKGLKYAAAKAFVLAGRKQRRIDRAKLAANDNEDGSGDDNQSGSESDSDSHSDSDGASSSDSDTDHDVHNSESEQSDDEEMGEQSGDEEMDAVPSASDENESEKAEPKPTRKRRKLSTPEADAPAPIAAADEKESKKAAGKRRKVQRDSDIEPPAAPHEVDSVAVLWSCGCCPVVLLSVPSSTSCL